jgi:hypothetical protein
VAFEAVASLWNQFDRAPNQVKGDILYLFGEIGGPGTSSLLETVLAGKFDSEVKEAAQEALEKITDPY